MFKRLGVFCTKYFKIKEHNSELKTEILAGITNYFTLIYAVMLVPEILIEAFPGAVNANGDIIKDAIVYGNITAAQVLVALTAIAFIAAGFASVFIGTIVNLPFVQGPSVAIATFVTYTICRGFGYSYNQALTLVFISGLLFFILSASGLEAKLHEAIPNNLKYAVSAGIGFFIACTGLSKAHIINFSDSAFATIFSLNMADKNNVSAVLALVVVIFIAVMLKKHVHGAIFIGKIACIIAAIPLGLIAVKNSFEFGYNMDVAAFAVKLDFGGLLDLSGGRLLSSVLSIVIIIFCLCIMDIFETISMFIAMDNYIDVSRKNEKGGKELPHIMEVDAATTCFGSLIGSTSISTYVESTAGVIEGGRTGMTAFVTGFLFLSSVPFSPLVSLVPSAATATTLIVAGVLMMGVLRYIDFNDITEAVPAFLTMVLMPFTNSLLIGISIGVVSYVLIHIFCGRQEGKKISPLLYIIGFLMLIAFIFIPRA